MDILLVTNSFASFGIATRLATEGHKVSVYNGGNIGQSFGAGLVKFEAHPLEAIKACEYIIADGRVRKDIYDLAKTYNKPIIGSSPVTDMMNLDVYKEVQIAQRLGIPLPTTEIVDDVSTLYSKVLDWNPRRTIIRFDRESITIDQQQWMAWAMTSLPLGKRLVLQTPDYGEVVDVVGWFDGSKWAEPFLLKSINDNGLRASMLLALYDREWVDKLVRPWGKFLGRTNYKGPFRARLSVTKNESVLLSTHTGIEFPSIYAFLEGLKDNIADFFRSIAFGSTGTYGITKDYMSAVSVGTALTNPEGVPIIGVEEGNEKHIFFGNVAKTENGLIISKGIPWVYVTTARGRDIDESLGRAYFTSTVVKIPEPNHNRGLQHVYKPWLRRVETLGYL